MIDTDVHFSPFLSYCVISTLDIRIDAEFWPRKKIQIRLAF